VLVTAPVLTRRQLNRATLARQMLLERVDTTAVEAEARRFIELVSPGGRHDVVVTVRE
jgi:hypothetical protein